METETNPVILFTSEEPEDRISTAVLAIKQATALLRDDYEEWTEWRGYPNEARDVVNCARQLLTMAVPSVLSQAEGRS